MKVTSNSPEETLNLGYRFGKKLKPGAVVALKGELGTGKTLFTKGIARALGVREYEYVNSPSFVIVKEYRSKKTPLYHFDLYRIKSRHDLDTVDYEEYFYSNGITVIEWADRATDVLPEKYIAVEFKHSGQNKREIAINDSRFMVRQAHHSSNHPERPKEVPSEVEGRSRGTIHDSRKR